MLKKVSQILISSIIMLILATPILIGAQNTQGTNQSPNTQGTNQPPASQIILKNPFKGGNSITSLIRTIIDSILLPIGGLVAALMVMYAGFLYVTAAGDPGQIKKAHQTLLYAVIGAAILLGAWVISEAIQGTINQLKTS